MNLVTRLLPASEWAKLTGTELETVYPFCHPDTTTIVAVQDEAGAVVGCWALMQVAHVEGLWIAPAHRKKASVGRDLLKAMQGVVTERGLSHVVTGAVTDEVRRLIQHLGGVQLPGTTHVLALGER